MRRPLRRAIESLLIMAFMGSTGCCCVGGGGSGRGAKPAKGGEATVYVAPVPCAVQTVAVFPFQAPTELIGASVSDLFVTEILRSGRYEVVERSQLSKVLQETEVHLSGLTDNKAVELGKMVGADGVIVGSVDEYGMQARRGSSYAVVGISVRLIETRTGSVLWSATMASTARDPEVSLSQHARATVRALMSELAARWHVQSPALPGTRGGGGTLRAPASR